MTQERRRTGFWYIAEDEPDRPALILPDGRVRTYGDLYTEANRIARGLRWLGLEEGDGIVTVVQNGESYFTLQLAAMQIGIYFTAANHHLTVDELAYILQDSEAGALVCSEEHAGVCDEAVRAAGLAPGRGFVDGDASIGCLQPLSRLVDDQPGTLPANRVPGKLMSYTSGTTGRPKGIRRKVRAGDPSEIASRSTGYASGFGLVPFAGVNLVEGPLYHAGPYGLAWGSLHLGHAQVITTRFDAEELLSLVERHRVTSTSLVTTMFHRLLRLPASARSRYDVSSLQMVMHSASPTPVETKQQMMDWWGPVLWEMYGGTEGTATRVGPKEWLERPGTVGRPVDDKTEILILDAEGNPCAAGETGRVFIRKAQAFEYWKDPEKTKAAHEGGAFHLGDMGRLDDDGYLYLTGRASEVIISGGVNIYPAEIESRLLAHPDVVDVAVIGAPDEEWGERVVAYVQPESGRVDDPALAEELIAFCRDGLAKFKCPKEVEVRERLPRDDNGKLYRKQLRDARWEGAGRWI